MELNFEGPQMQKWNQSTERAQRVAEKNGVICYSHKNLTIDSFFDDSQRSVTVWVKYLCATEWSYWFLSKNGMINRIWSDHSWDIERKNIRKTAEPAKNTEIFYFQGLASC